jgi:acyl-CoA thioesterase FadM
MNNVSYFRHAETGRISFMHQVLEQKLSKEAFKEVLSATEAGLIVKSLQLSYKSPVVYPDVLTWATRVKKATLEKDRFVLEFIAVSHEQTRLVAHGEAFMVYYDFKHSQKTALPDTLFEILLKSLE